MNSNLIHTNKVFQLLLLAVCVTLVTARTASSQATTNEPAEFLFHDSHFHLTNYVQEGIDIRAFLEIMGDKVGRSMLSGIPLQHQWMQASTGEFAPTYYTQTDAPLYYYYSFTDAKIAMTYLSLSAEDRGRFDPMITGFNPTDMYAADHIRRVLETFPGVFSVSVSSRSTKSLCRRKWLAKWRRLTTKHSIESLSSQARSGYRLSSIATSIHRFRDPTKTRTSSKS
jgi:hypothetical protein